MQGAGMSPGSVQFDKTDPRCFHLYQAGVEISGTCEVMSLARGHLGVSLEIWKKNWVMDSLYSKDHISNVLGKKEIWAET